ncbi:hypothetical protein WNY78_05965 [Psychroserpens sp. AS72]|uniref:hypothetical protein n=1 Tax=Psychroserpens sp. AS72 TaxID=3135775 RepID=UPI00318093FE
MNLKTLFRILLSIGAILWVISWIGDLNGKLPESTYGMILSAILTGFGIYFWLKSYKKTRGHYPKFHKKYQEMIKSMKKNPFNGIFFLVKNLFKFYTFVLVFSMILVLIGYLTIGQSEPVKVTQKYCENNIDVQKITGEIKHYGILRNVSSRWNSETGNSDLSLVFVAENGVFNISTKLEKENGEWEVKKYELKNKNTGANNGSK